MKQYDKAIADFSKTIQLEPGFPPPYQQRGNAYRDKKNYEAAKKDYDMFRRLTGEQ